jgi:hypothetical protein
VIQITMAVLTIQVTMIVVHMILAGQAVVIRQAMIQEVHMIVHLQVPLIGKLTVSNYNGKRKLEY